MIDYTYAMFYYVIPQRNKGSNGKITASDHTLLSTGYPTHRFTHCIRTTFSLQRTTKEAVQEEREKKLLGLQSFALHHFFLL